MLLVVDFLKNFSTFQYLNFLKTFLNHGLFFVMLIVKREITYKIENANIIQWAFELSSVSLFIRACYFPRNHQHNKNESMI